MKRGRSTDDDLELYKDLALIKNFLIDLHSAIDCPSESCIQQIDDAYEVRAYGYVEPIVEDDLRKVLLFTRTGLQFTGSMTGVHVFIDMMMSANYTPLKGALVVRLEQKSDADTPFVKRQFFGGREE